MKKLLIFVFVILFIPSIAYGFGYCGEAPSSKHVLTKQDKQKADRLLKTVSRDSIKNNCMDCHYMINLVSKMNKKQQSKWFDGIRDLRGVVNEINPGPKIIKNK
ncbi:MAG TPA: hypothetical protein ENI54_02245 [bacterium]|nr:hypothetical protein [bacterium]